MTPRSLRTVVALGAVSLSAFGCDPPVQSANAQVGFAAGGLHLDSTADPAALPAVLSGSQFCPEFAGFYGADGAFIEEPRVEECFALQDAQGRALPDGGCLYLDVPGEDQLNLIPRACSVESFVLDHVPFAVAAPEDLELRADAALLRSALATQITKQPVPEDLVPPADQTIAIAGESDAVISGALFLRGSTDVAAWNHGEFVLLSRAGEPKILPLSEEAADAEVLLELPLGRVRASAGDAVSLRYEASGTTFESAPLPVSVATEAVSLDLVAFYGNPDREGDRPLAVHAIIEDTSGRRVVGAAVDWTLEGDALRSRQTLVPYLDVLEVDGNCGDVAERQATVTGSYGDLDATATLRWNCEGVDDDAESDDDDGGLFSEDSEFGEAGCGCELGDPSRGGAMFVLLGVLFGVARRRRRGTARS